MELERLPNKCFKFSSYWIFFKHSSPVFSCSVFFSRQKSARIMISRGSSIFLFPVPSTPAFVFTGTNVFHIAVIARIGFSSVCSGINNITRTVLIVFSSARVIASRIEISAWRTILCTFFVCFFLSSACSWRSFVIDNLYLRELDNAPSVVPYFIRYVQRQTVKFTVIIFCFFSSNTRQSSFHLSFHHRPLLQCESLGCRTDSQAFVRVSRWPRTDWD